MSKFIAITPDDVVFKGESLQDIFNEASECCWDIDELSFYNLGDKIEVELRVVPVMSQQISAKKGK